MIEIDKNKDQVKIRIKRIEKIGVGKWKVKIDKNDINLTSIIYNGMKLETITHLKRGRYIMKEVK